MAKRKKPTLPVKQLTILAICRFAEPVASTSVYPYIPEMIQSFNIPPDQAAKYAGWLSAVFSLSQCLTAIAWGRASDRLGRKPMILLALTCVMTGSLAFGFSSSLAMAFISRSFQGLSSGNVGIIRTSVAEMVPERELQPRAFSIMPLVWNIGSIFGPSLGGSLVRPPDGYGGLFGKIALLDNHPYALPNILISVIFLIGILTGFLFLHETHQDKKHQRDYGLVLGRLITRPCRRTNLKGRHWKHRKPRNTDENHSSDEHDNDEAEPFLGEAGNQLEDSPNTPRKRTQEDLFPKPKPKEDTGWKQVFSTQSNINLVAYTGLAMHSIAYDQVLPVFLNYPPNDQIDSPIKLPFKFAGGFGLKSSRIGLLFTIYGFFGMLVQFLVFPPLARRFGVLRCFKACALTFPFVYLLQPFTSLIETNNGRQAACLMLMLVKCVAGIFAFPCSTIMLTNSAASLKILGTLNGVATSVSAIGRAAGPALAGAAFAAGVDHGYVLLPFWVLAIVSVIAAVPIWWLIEMEGFQAKDHESDDESDDRTDDDSDHEYEDHSEGDEIPANDRPRAARENRVDDDQNDNDNEDTMIDAPPPRRSSSPKVIRGDVAAASGTDAVDIEPSQPRRISTASTTPGASDAEIRRGSQANTSNAKPISERNTLKRVVSNPIGTGPGILVAGARRYSSELGVSRSGMGAGGTTFH